MSLNLRWRRKNKASIAALLHLVAMTMLIGLSAPAVQAGSASAVQADSAPAVQAGSASLVWRDGRIVNIRGGTANSQFNFGVGMFANGIIDYNGRLIAGTGCTPSDSSRVSCGVAGSWNQVRGNLGPGNDTIGTIIPMRFSGVSGGYGRDTFYGTSERDVLYGGPGNDLLKGYEGDDYLAGGLGTDTIECGDGWDTADVDPYDRVSECEVKR